LSFLSAVTILQPKFEKLPESTHVARQRLLDQLFRVHSSIIFTEAWDSFVSAKGTWVIEGQNQGIG
jgi:hypothetical protein